MEDFLLIDNPKKLFLKGKHLKRVAKKDSRKNKTTISEYKKCRKMQKTLSKMRNAA